MHKELSIFVAKCDVCGRNKDENVSYLGLLQPLPILEQVWIDISMGFIEGFLTSHGKQSMFVVVDRLSKCAHFIPLLMLHNHSWIIFINCMACQS